MAIYMWLSWFAIALVVGYLVSGLGMAIRLKKWPAFVLGLLGIGTAFTALAAFRASAHPATASVSITSPSSGTAINGYHLTVVGTANPPDCRITLVIRSETDFRWWVQSVIRPQHVQGQLGVWSISALIGTPNEGQFRNFHIIALASADSFWFNLLTGGRYLTPGQAPPSVPLWNQSSPVVIWRTK